MRTQVAVVIAEACHAIQIAYAKSIGDTSIPAWKDLPGSTKYYYVDKVQECVADPDKSPQEVGLFYGENDRVRNSLFQATALSTNAAMSFNNDSIFDLGCMP